MLSIVLLPFTTSLIGDFPTHPLAELVFQVNLLIAGLLFFWQYHYTSKHHLIDTDKQHSDDFIEEIQTLLIPILSIIAIILTYENLAWSSLVYCTTPIILYLLHRYRSQRNPDNS